MLTFVKQLVTMKPRSGRPLLDCLGWHIPPEERPDGDGLDFARLMGTHLNLCIEQRKFVQCQATDNGSVFLLMDDVILGIQTAVDRVKAAGVPFFSDLSHRDSG